MFLCFFREIDFTEKNLQSLFVKLISLKNYYFFFSYQILKVAADKALTQSLHLG